MTALMFILFIISFLGYCIETRQRFRIPCGFVPLLVLSSHVACLAVFGYFGALRYDRFLIPIGFNPVSTPQIPFLFYGTWFMFGLSLILFVLNCLRFTKEGRNGVIRRFLQHPAIWPFFLLALLLFPAMQANQLRKFDEFSQGGLSTKLFLHYHSFCLSDTPLVFPSFPPGASLFEYYTSIVCLQGEGRISEGTWMYAMALLLLSGIARNCFRCKRQSTIKKNRM